MKSFLKYLLATIVGIIISTMLIFFIFMIIISAIASSGNKPVNIRSKSILYLSIDKPIIDRTSESPFDKFNLQSFKPEQKIGLNNLLDNIEKASRDKNIEGIYLDIGFFYAGYATIDEIRKSLISFKDSGKFIISYGEVFSQKAYYLASVSDKIYVTPTGLINFAGLHSEHIFFKRLIDKWGIEPQIIRGSNNKFKSAVEPLLLEKMSNESREQTNVYLNSIWDYVLQGIVNSRHIKKDSLIHYANTLAIVLDPDNAVKKGMIDGLKYEDEVLDELKSMTNLKESQKLRLVSLKKYTKVLDPARPKHLPKDKIAVVYASGTINLGQTTDDNIGSEIISKAIRKARKDSAIKAIVFRVNSPGGSLLASKIIWREMKLAAETKPVIASMGDVAASGGYYILSPSSKIIANPSTITGSIGIYAIIWNIQKLLNEKIGITTDRIRTNLHTDIGNPARPLTDDEKKMIQKIVDDGYEDFLTQVSEGRNMKKKEIEKIGQGRVWSGQNAKEIGLIDDFAGLKKAIELAAKEANIAEYRIVSLPKIKDPLEEFFKEITGEVKLKAIKQELGDNYKYYKFMNEAINSEGLQARMPFELIIY